ncbi:hypothetical protein [Aquisphaera insulae]|uniref:hypothetical protein n=1 Tax=Aquisphaera insulae TaxID=2712864 RepID=UPI0013EC2D6E|nr:hypothetical protein [Aquisphaera insulae]
MRRRCDLPHVGPRASLAAAFIAGLCLFVFPPTEILAQDVPAARGSSKLLELIPPDSGLVLTVDDLRAQWQDLAATKIFDSLSKTQLVQGWLRSDKLQELQAFRGQVEQILQLTLEELRDDILGDALVLSLHLPPEATDPNLARGLVVLKAKAPEKLSRVIEAMNEGQRNNGEIAAVARRKHGDVEFSVREFPSGSGKLDEAYVSWPDGVFALSNSEALIREAIDRKAGKSVGSSSKGDKPALDRFREVDRRLPDRALVRAFLDARIVERLLRNAPRPESPGETALRKFIEAHDAAGATLSVNARGLSIRVAESFDAKKLAAIAGRLPGASKPARIGPLPEGSLAVAAFQVDFAGLYEVFRRALPAAELARVEKIEAVGRGVLLGHDVRTDVLPRIGPQVTLAAREPASWDLAGKADPVLAGKSPLPLSVSLELGSREVVDAIDNAIQTALAAVSLEPRNPGGKPWAAVSEASGIKVRTLFPTIPAAYAADRAGLRLVIGSSAEAVERVLAATASAGSATGRFHRLQSAEFPSAHSFACVDLAAVHAAIAAHGDAISARLATGTHPRQSAAADLARIDEILGLLDSASWAARFDADPAALIQELRLVPRP